MDDEIANLEDAARVCDQILARRAEQLADCRKDMEYNIKIAAAMHCSLESRKIHATVSGKKDQTDKPFLRFVKDVGQSPVLRNLKTKSLDDIRCLTLLEMKMQRGAYPRLLRLHIVRSSEEN